MQVRQKYEKRGVIIRAIDIDFNIYSFFLLREVNLKRKFLRALNKDISRKKNYKSKIISQKNKNKTWLRWVNPIRS